MQLDELEKKQKSDKQVRYKKIKDIERNIKCKTKQEHSDGNFKCSECEFFLKTKSSCKVHKVRIQTKTKNLQYPVECELCYAKVENERDMKERMKIHSHKKSTFKCEDCEYCSENFLTMEVHVGKDHIENIKCGLCDVQLMKQQILKN